MPALGLGLGLPFATGGLTADAGGGSSSGPPTLGTLALSSTTATAGVPYSGTISGNTAGSTITAASSDGTTLTVVGTTVSGTFAGPGTPTVTLTETLAGATNTPHATGFGFTVSAGGGGTPAGTLGFDWSDPNESLGQTL